MRLWIASLFFYIFIFIFCEFLRLIIKKLFENERNKDHQNSTQLIAHIAYEFIGTLQLCAPMFDVNFVMDNYGLSGVFLEICFIEFVNSFLLRRAHADPCSLFYSYINGQHSPRIASLLMITQFAAGYFSYFVSKTFFSFGFHFKHLEAFEENCSSDLTVAIIYGSAVEAIGLLCCKMAEHFIDENIINEKFVTIVLSIVSGLITILGINLTGMYANPIVAWALTFNCGEVTHFAHFIVYWFAPLCAFFLSKCLFVDEQEVEESKENEKKEKKVK